MEQLKFGFLPIGKNKQTIFHNGIMAKKYMQGKISY